MNEVNVNFLIIELFPDSLCKLTVDRLVRFSLLSLNLKFLCRFTKVSRQVLFPDRSIKSTCSYPIHLTLILSSHLRLEPPILIFPLLVFYWNVFVHLMSVLHGCFIVFGMIEVILWRVILKVLQLIIRLLILNVFEWKRFLEEYINTNWKEEKRNIERLQDNIERSVFMFFARRIISIFRVEEWTKQDTSVKHVLLTLLWCYIFQVLTLWCSDPQFIDC
jgi:hypothetical protein